MNDLILIGIIVFICIIFFWKHSSVSNKNKKDSSDYLVDYDNNIDMGDNPIDGDFDID